MGKKVKLKGGGEGEWRQYEYLKDGAVHREWTVVPTKLSRKQLREQQASAAGGGVEGEPVTARHKPDRWKWLRDLRDRAMRGEADVSTHASRTAETYED